MFSRLAGESRASEKNACTAARKNPIKPQNLITTSRNVDAEEAYRLGLLDRLVGDDELIEASMELANQIAG